MTQVSSPQDGSDYALGLGTVACLQWSQSLKRSRVAPHVLDRLPAMLARSCLDRPSLHSQTSILSLPGIRRSWRRTPITSAVEKRQPCMTAPRLPDRSSRSAARSARGPFRTERSRTVDDLTPSIKQLQVYEAPLLLHQVDSVAIDHMVHA